MMMELNFPAPALDADTTDAKFWDAYRTWRAAVDAFEADDSPEGSPRFAQLEEAHLTAIDPMLATSTTTAEGLLAKLQQIKEGGSNMLDMQVHPAYTAFDVILWDVERLAKQGLTFVPWQVGGEGPGAPAECDQTRGPVEN